MLLRLLRLRQCCKQALTPDALNVASYTFTLPYKCNHKAIVTGDSLSGLEDAPSPTESYSGKKTIIIYSTVLVPTVPVSLGIMLSASIKL